MAAASDLEKHQNQDDSPLLKIKRVNIIFLSRWYCGYGISCSTERSTPPQKKDEDSAPVGGIVAIAAAEALRKYKKQDDLTLVGTNKE